MHTVAVADLPTLETTVLGPGHWQEVSQQQVNQFADATGDHQWIHVDPERAATGPFGRTIAHGYLTLSLIPALLDELLQVQDAGFALAMSRLVLSGDADEVVNMARSNLRNPATTVTAARKLGSRTMNFLENPSRPIGTSAEQTCALGTPEMSGFVCPVLAPELISIARQPLPITTSRCYSIHMLR